MANKHQHLITADLHLGHNLVSGLRGFNNADSHDEWLLTRISEQLTATTTLWILGDVAMRLDALKQLRELPGKLNLVSGNHDYSWHRRSKPASVRRALKMNAEHYAPVFSEVYTSGHLRYLDGKGRAVIMSHLPASGDHKTVDRYQDRRPQLGDLPILCGHVHGAWRTKGRQLNVGVDVNDFRALDLSNAIAEACALDGMGASENVILPGVWNQYGLG